MTIKIHNYLRFTEFGMIIWQDVQRMAGNDREGRILASMLRNITPEGLAGTKLWAPDLHYLTEKHSGMIPCGPLSPLRQYCRRATYSSGLSWSKYSHERGWSRTPVHELRSLSCATQHPWHIFLACCWPRSLANPGKSKTQRSTDFEAINIDSPRGLLT